MTKARDLASALLSRGAVDGFTVSTPGLQYFFEVSPGVCLDSTGQVVLRRESTIRKDTNPWAAGGDSTNGAQGGSDSGGNAVASTWYYIFVIGNASGTLCDVIYSQTLTPVLPSGYTHYRRVAAWRTNASTQWEQIYQFGDKFIWKTIYQEVGTSGHFTEANAAPKTFTMTRLPDKLTVEAMFRVGGSGGGGGANYFQMQPIFQIDEAVNWQHCDVYNDAIHAKRTEVIAVNAQIKAKPFQTNTNTVVVIHTLGWIDPRGRE